MKDAEHKVFRQTPAGWVVFPNDRVKIPGVFQNFLHAERALEAYRAKEAECKKLRDTKKRTKSED